MQKDILSYQKENASYSKFYFCSMLEDLTNKKKNLTWLSIKKKNSNLDGRMD